VTESLKRYQSGREFDPERLEPVRKDSPSSAGSKKSTVRRSGRCSTIGPSRKEARRNQELRRGEECPRGEGKEYRTSPSRRSGGHFQ
jgi:hypothetical protein